MLNYDFKILHSNEFEWFTRDLLQASEGLRIENFAEGPDGGIDLRYMYDTSKKCIIQCKRYQTWRDLKKTLKQEVSKVKNLKPDRYILSTSVDLTAANKDFIKDLFAPYIKDTTKDILGKSDLNNLLGCYPKIEKQYYKLWLGSTTILDHILSKSIINWSEFEREDIISEVGKYVQNESFNKALKIVNENRYVIISGIPGIGKTTLARMLVYFLLAKDNYDEFVYIVDDLDNVSKVYDENKKQVFFFDDFLGSNTFKQQGISFENKLISFIKRVKKSKHTIFIMTTREYILSAAKCYYEKIDLNNIEIAKCTIDLSHYTEFVKAQILYNHLAEAKLPIKYIDTLITGKNYMNIINHRNFNPRVIEGFINKQIWVDLPPEKFMRSILDFFDRPLSVWEKAFTNLDISARYALLVFATFGNGVDYDEWQAAYKYFCEKTHDELHLIYEDVLWLTTVKILQDCFVKIKLRSGEKMVSPFNPSILDFCASYIRENKTTLKYLLMSALYPEQLTTLFTDSMNPNEAPGWQVEIPQDLLDRTLQGIWTVFDSGYYSQNIRRNHTIFFLELLKKFPVYCRSHESFIETNYNFNELLSDSVFTSDKLELMRNIDWEHAPINAVDVLLAIAENERLDSPEWVDYIDTVKELGLFERLDNSLVFIEMGCQLEEEIENVASSDELEEITDNIIQIYRDLPNWDRDDLFCMLEDKKEELQNTEEEDDYPDDHEYYYYKTNDDNSRIHEMFTSLYEDSASD